MPADTPPVDTSTKPGQRPPAEALPEEDLVITPAGLVRKNNVHLVQPDQTVRRNSDGSYAIVPTED